MSTGIDKHQTLFKPVILAVSVTATAQIVTLKGKVTNSETGAVMHTEDKDVIPSYLYSDTDKKMPATIQNSIDSTFRKIKILPIANCVH